MKSSFKMHNKKLTMLGSVFLGGLMLFGIYSLLESTFYPNRLIAQDLKVPDATVSSIGGKYKGPLENEFYQGKGTFKYNNGGHYEGDFAGSKRQGEGIFKWKNGDSYVGSWKDDNMDYGTYTFKDGRTYKGQFKNNNLFQGHIELGKVAPKYGFLSFRADVKEGKLYAIVYKKDDGSTYNGLINGYAEIRYPTGNTYVGNVVNCVRHGAGTFRWMYNNYQNTRSYYAGQWADNNMNGEGTYFYSSAQYPCITGNFSYGKPQGKAIYYKSADNTFVTQWQHGTCVNNNI